MLATNPVEPHQMRRIELLGPAGPHSNWPRKHDDAPFPVAKFLGVSALLVAGYVALGTLGANATQLSSASISEPAAKVAPAIKATAATPVPGEFRLAPGNTMPQGVVPGVGAAGPVPGEFRLAPGNNTPQGVVVRIEVPEPIPGDFRLSPGNSQPVGIVPAQ